VWRNWWAIAPPPTRWVVDTTPSRVHTPSSGWPMWVVDDHRGVRPRWHPRPGCPIGLADHRPARTSRQRTARDLVMEKSRFSALLRASVFRAAPPLRECCMLRWMTRMFFSSAFFITAQSKAPVSARRSHVILGSMTLVPSSEAYSCGSTRPRWPPRTTASRKSA